MTSTAIWSVRARHPQWWPRIVRSRLRAAWLWRLQGCPTDIPVVLKAGRLIASPDGRGTVADWHFDCRYMKRSVTGVDLWDRLSALYPVERTGT